MRIFILALAICVAVPAICAAAEPPALAITIDQQKVEARNLLSQGKFQEAYDLYIRLMWERPDDDEINFGLARSAINIKKYYQAIVALEKLVDKYPADLNLRTELARVYVIVGDTASAKREFDYLKRHNVTLTDEDAEAAYEALLKQQSPFRYRGRVAAGILYDSNANLGPVSEIIHQYFRVPGVKHEPSFGATANITADGSYDIGDSAGWLLAGDVGLYDRYNFNSDLPSNNNVLWMRAAFGGRYIASRYLIDFKAKDELVLQRNDNSSDQTINSAGPEVLFSYMLVPQVSLITRGVAEYRSYNIAMERNGWFWSLGESVRYFFLGSGHEITAGGRISGMETENDKRANYFSWELNLRGGIRLGNFRIDPYGAYKEDSYREPANVLDTEDREDKQWKAGLAVVWDFAERWAADASYQYTNNDSSSELYVYEQHLVNMGIAWKF